MRFFTLHERPADGGSDVIAVASGFSWIAAFVPMIWLLWHRLWLGLALYLLFGLLLGAALDFGGIAEPAALVIGLAVSFLIGAMAADFRRWTYQRRGWRMLGVVMARNVDEAEARYMHSVMHAVQGAAPAAQSWSSFRAPAVPPKRSGPDVFPRLV